MFLNFIIYIVMIIQSNRRLFDKDSSHLPHGHLPVVGVGVVVPLDGGEVGVVGQEDGGQQSFVLLSPETGRDGDVAELIKYLV